MLICTIPKSFCIAKNYSTTKLLLGTTNYKTSLSLYYTNLYDKVVLCSFPPYYHVLLRTTKSYSSTNLYYKEIFQFFCARQLYYIFLYLQKLFPDYLLCIAKYESSITLHHREYFYTIRCITNYLFARCGAPMSSKDNI